MQCTLCICGFLPQFVCQGLAVTLQEFHQATHNLRSREPFSGISVGYWGRMWDLTGFCFFSLVRVLRVPFKTRLQGFRQDFQHTRGALKLRLARSGLKTDWPHGGRPRGNIPGSVPHACVACIHIHMTARILTIWFNEITSCCLALANAQNVLRADSSPEHVR